MKTEPAAGAALPGGQGGPGISAFLPLIRATNGLTLGQVCAITGLEPSTVQNWVKRGFVARPVGKKYRERQLARILLICALRDSLQIDSVGALMAMVNGNANDERDDIVPEEDLYDDFCALVGRLGAAPPPAEDVAAHAAAVTAGYAGLDRAKQRLTDALTVMGLAYVAAQYKQQAERKLREMKEEVQ